MKNMIKQLGQGMTEYIIIVALIAVAAIGIYGFFGDTIRGQMGVMTQELGGTAGVRTGVTNATTAAGTEAAVTKSLNNYEQ